MDSTTGQLRIAVGTICQETNTFAIGETVLDDFLKQGLWVGEQAHELTQDTNSEFAGAYSAIEASGNVAVPIIRAWAMSGGVLESTALLYLRDTLLRGLQEALPLDGVVLCLHGALVAEAESAADASLVEAARGLVGQRVPIVVTHDLHANLTGRIVRAANAVVGYKTYPHIDMADTGKKAAQILIDAIRSGVHLSTAVSKCPMIVPAEAQGTDDEPMRELVKVAQSEETAEGIVDISLFPVQPWLDVPELGFGVTVTSSESSQLGAEIAERICEVVWSKRAAFKVPLLALNDAIARAGSDIEGGDRLVLLVQSSDSPTAGSSADSPVVIDALLKSGVRLKSLATVVDRPAVGLCHQLGEDAQVETVVGATIDPRWSSPTEIKGSILRVGDTPVILTGSTFTGMEINIGRWATIACDTGTVVLVTEAPAPTFDPECFRHVGCDPLEFQLVVVRSANMYRGGYAGLYDKAYVLDLPGVSTPNIAGLAFARAPRNLYPMNGGGDKFG